MTYEPHEPDLAAFVVVPAHELVLGDTLLDLGGELTGAIVALHSTDLSEPGDHGLLKMLVDLAWRGEILTRTPIIIDQTDLRIIAVREGHP
ncbi:hypothetical protein [Gordonia paraffinivorans]|uniref:hypothetical protein n=1 Tax=Gordonia paraffinivorans TaxID=175628 RepID=UPI001447CE5D|nr:hypothetical protein [Gordonia paraffinivorans]